MQLSCGVKQAQHLKRHAEALYEGLVESPLPSGDLVRPRRP